MTIRVCRDFQTKEVFDVYDFWNGRTYGGSWRKLMLPETGWKRIFGIEVIVIYING